ncbi:adenine deaminase [Parvicella tangerina]|uniref:Adenine deaminase n=1 Tax=Parvicella tangerina TaxID=2829795 RepID=A0A916NHF7_9FLAO|nr:adenine deaminase [Parvicella tangerina]CAG5082923.1 Adenine deaminase [Parvicella tangerina]
MNMIEGKIVDVIKKEIFEGSIHFSEGIITRIDRHSVSTDHYIIPGFVDAHVHVESSMLTPNEFARLAVCHGTVGTISDPHEIGNVLGKKGVEFMIENGLKTSFKFHFGAPSCVPATVFETAGATITVDDIEELFKLPRVNYLAEVMNYPGVINRDPEVMAKIDLAHRLGKVVDGHAPGVMGEAAIKYIEAGITTDHECFTKEEALHKLRHGMKIIIREGSAAKNFEALYELIDEYPDLIMLCSDDKHPNDLMRGHINHLAARAIAKGCDLFNVLRATSKTPIEHYDMDIGLLRLGDPADFCIVRELKTFEVLQTFIDGNLVAEYGQSFIKKHQTETLNNFNCSPIKPEQLKIASHNSAEVNVIAVEDGQLVTEKTTAELQSVNEELQANVDKDILKIVVVNRYFDAPPALGFVKNFGLKEGAIASCVAHDSHNIIAVGTNDNDLTNAINLIIHERGGISLAHGAEKHVVGLPIAGIMTDQDGYEIGREYEILDQRAKELGATLSAPYMTLSFCALLVIPKIKLSDKGLFDGEKFEFVKLIN